MLIPIQKQEEIVYNPHKGWKGKQWIGKKIQNTLLEKIGKIGVCFFMEEKVTCAWLKPEVSNPQAFLEFPKLYHENMTAHSSIRNNVNLHDFLDDKQK